MGPSTKDGRRFKKQITRTKNALEKLLDQRAMWMRVGSNGNEEDHRISSDALKEMLRSGDMPWAMSGIGVGLYLGKLAHRSTADLERCIEEVADLRVQKNRLSQWLLRTSDAIDERLECVEGGASILLRRWKCTIDSMIEQWDKMCF